MMRREDEVRSKATELGLPSPDQSSGRRREQGVNPRTAMTKTVTLEEFRAATADARAALRMIREVVEQNAPPGTVPAEEYVEPPFTKEAEALVKGILAIVEAKRQPPDA